VSAPILTAMDTLTAEPRLRDALVARLSPPFLSGEGFAARVRSDMGGSQPGLVHASPQAALLIGLDAEALADPAFADFFVGKTPPSALTATVYSGHQFGQYVPRLGDGRALSYGVVEGPDGPIEIQLKGAGRTPFSRFADGRAVMRSSIREHLCSEAMAALGVPTTRSLSVIGTGEAVQRETIEPGAVVTRLAPSFIRFGHFEFFAHSGQPERLHELVQTVMGHHFPHLAAGDYAAFFREVCTRTAELMAKWQSVGFSHGVMNTDNMSILGLTIDYGPFGFMDAYDPMFICNHSDHGGRYAFARQPSIGLWNCQALASALSGLIGSDDLDAGLKAYEPAYHAEILRLMRLKLGFASDEPGDAARVQGLLTLMAKARADYALTFRRLANLDQDDEAFLLSLFGAHAAEAAHWLGQWRARMDGSHAAMRAANPAYMPRNWVCESAIRSVEDDGDTGLIARIFALLTKPFEDRPASGHAEDMRFADPPPDALRHLEVSCSS
jgi:serine/tyrosine/threonine adenylyltransferase